jgi:hypothetical protein
MMILTSDVFADGAGSRASFSRTGWVGAEYVAMGMTGSVIAGDIYSIYWNPAGLNELKRKKKLSENDVTAKARDGKISSIREKDLLDFSEDKSDAMFFDVGLSGSMLAESINAVFAGVAFGLFNGVLGVGAYTLGSANIALFDEFGTPNGTETYISGVSYLSYAWSMGITDIGVTAKGLYERIDDTTYLGGGFDFGVKVSVIPFLTVGFTVTDLGVGLKPIANVNNVKNKYDMTYPSLNVGASLNTDSGFMFAGTVSKRLEQDGYILSVGVKYALAKYMNVILGMSDSCFSAGVSVKTFGFNIAYGFSFSKIDNGMNNTVSVSFLF